MGAGGAKNNDTPLGLVLISFSTVFESKQTSIAIEDVVAAPAGSDRNIIADRNRVGCHIIVLL